MPVVCARLSAAVIIRPGPLIALAALWCALAACAPVPPRVADEFRADGDPARNHYLKTDLEEEPAPGGGANTDP